MKEVVRQLRLRDIGGIIVIDFIDMASPKNRAAVEQALGEELERDRTKTYVVEISPLGLVEMTRQNVTDGPREVMTKKCPTCGGDGIVVSEQTAAVDIERRLRSLVTPGSRDKAFKVEVAAKVGALVVGPGGARLRELEETTKRRFFLVGKEGEHLDHFKVLDQGTLEKVAPSLPVDVGQELEVKLGEVGLHDAHAGVGKVDDIEIVVGDAAKLVGKKVKVRVTVVTEGLAWAELVDPVNQAPEPLTAESEAEKPTRARRSTPARKDSGESDEVEVADVDDDDEIGTLEVAELEIADVDLEDDEVDVDADGETVDAASDDATGETVAGEAGADGEGAPPKKRTRRGSRGGRNRKKKTSSRIRCPDGRCLLGERERRDRRRRAGSFGGSGRLATSRTRTNRAAAGPVIHVPGRDLGDPADRMHPRPRRSAPAAARAAARTAASPRRPVRSHSPRPAKRARCELDEEAGVGEARDSTYRRGSGRSARAARGAACGRVAERLRRG